MPRQSVDLHELLQHVLLEARAAWRYRWRALIVAWCVMIVGALLVFGMPSQYEAKAQVYADTEALTNPLLQGIAVQPDVRARLQIITHTLLSRPNLQTVADKTGLSVRATTPVDKDELLTQLGNAVKIKDAGTVDLYNISYADPDRKMAQKVVQAFLQILMNDTLGANTASTETVQKFLQQQVADYGKRLNEAEQKLADFEKANVGYVPSQGGGGYAARLQAAETQLQILQGQYDAAVAVRATAYDGGPEVDPRIRALDQQIASYRQQLDKLLLLYTDQYPDVITLRGMIAQLEAQRAAISQGGGAVAAVAPRRHGYTGNAQALAAQIARQKKQIADLKGGADKAADVQATMAQLSRNYDITKKQYDQLVTRLNTAELSQDATQSGNNLKFRVIDPPIVPLLPASPKRGLLLFVVFALALAIGAGFAYFMHKIRPVFISLELLREFGGHPVLGAVSLIVTPAQSREKRREVIRFCTGAAMLAVVLVVGLAFAGPLARLVQHFFVMGAA